MTVDYLGVYGVCLKDNRVLSIKKTTGSYKNRYDLPGGIQKHKEGFTETLVREYLEETGYLVNSCNNCRVYDVEIETYQLKEIQTFLGNEKNDSAGIYQMDISELNITNVSPLLLKLKQEILNDDNLLEKTKYKSWKIL